MNELKIEMDVINAETSAVNLILIEMMGNTIKNGDELKKCKI